MMHFWRMAAGKTGQWALVASLIVAGFSPGLNAQAAEQGLLDWLAQQQIAKPSTPAATTPAVALPAITTEAELLNQLSQLEQQPVQQIITLLRARQQMTPAAQLAVMPALKARMDARSGDANTWMTYGFAQVVLERNKTGLFFLRKANDQLQSGTSSLAYAIAQADVERTMENVDPAEITVRKLDVAYLLHQAAQQDAARHEPGFWPLFADAVSQMQGWSGYSTLLTRDYSELYVPLGNRSVKFVAPSTVEQYLATRGIASPAPKPQKSRLNQSTAQSTTPVTTVASARPKFRFFWQKEKPVTTAAVPVPVNTAAVTSDPSASVANPAVNTYVAVPVATASPAPTAAPVITQQQQGTLIETRHLQMTGDPTQWVTVQYSTLTPQQPVTAYPFQATILTKNNQPLGRITVPNKLSLAEDLDRDGNFELVVRQYSLVPRFPVRVFHITAQGLVEDPAVTRLFE